MLTLSLQDLLMQAVWETISGLLSQLQRKVLPTPVLYLLHSPATLKEQGREAVTCNQEEWLSWPALKMQSPRISLI